MRIRLRGLGIGTTPAIEEHVERRLHFALGRFAGQLSEVVVRFEDVNGPRGGEDMACRFVARLRSGVTVRIEERSRDLYSAVDRGADRLRHAVSREQARRHRRPSSVLRPAWSSA